MSFCNPNRVAGRGEPGSVRGNPTRGLCESVALEVKRVFDGCISRTPRENVTVTIVQGGGGVAPFTFISCASNGNKGEVSNVSFTPIEGSTRRQIVSCNVSVPINIVYRDSTGAEFVGSGSFDVPVSTVLCVPENSIVPVTVESITAVTCFSGEYVSENTFSINCCTILIVKLVAEVEMLFPTYGYVEFEPCRDVGQAACRGFFNTPLYPFAPRNNNT